MKFNRRQTVILPGSDCGIQRSPAVEETRIGRFLPCHIVNMDQTPLPFEFGNGKTYDTKGNRTVFVRIGKNGNDKRKLTLQLAITADGKPHIRPLCIFAGAEGAAAAAKPRRRKEAKEYHPDVDVIFNEKAWYNLKVILTWLKGQYKWGSPYPPSEREPRLLVLDSFRYIKLLVQKHPRSL